MGIGQRQHYRSGRASRFSQLNLGDNTLQHLQSFRFGRNPALGVLTVLTLALQLGVIYIQPLADAFKLTPLSREGLAATAALGVLTFVLVHLERRFQSKH